MELEVPVTMCEMPDRLVLNIITAIFTEYTLLL
jgi:hypothetical protein